MTGRISTQHASVILQATYSREKGHYFVAESTIGTGRWVCGVGTPGTGRELDQPLHAADSILNTAVLQDLTAGWKFPGT